MRDLRQEITADAIVTRLPPLLLRAMRTRVIAARERERASPAPPQYHLCAPPQCHVHTTTTPMLDPAHNTPPPGASLDAATWPSTP